MILRKENGYLECIDFVCLGQEKNDLDLNDCY